MGIKEIKGEYKRGRGSKHGTQFRNFVRLSDTKIYVKDATLASGEKRHSKSKTVFVGSIENKTGVIFENDMPYKVFLENEKWYLEGLATLEEVVEVAV